MFLIKEKFKEKKATSEVINKTNKHFMLKEAALRHTHKGQPYTAVEQ